MTTTFCVYPIEINTYHESMELLKLSGREDHCWIDFPNAR